MGWLEGILVVIGAVAKAVNAPKEERARLIADQIAAHDGAVEAVAAFWEATGGELARGLAAIARAKAKQEPPPEPAP
jgi:hypothetical protein